MLWSKLEAVFATDPRRLVLIKYRHVRTYFSICSLFTWSLKLPIVISSRLSFTQKRLRLLWSYAHMALIEGGSTDIFGTLNPLDRLVISEV